MKLATRYLGLDLPHPIIVGASPLTDGLETARALQDAGAAALVMRSLFAEQLELEQEALLQREEPSLGVNAEADSYFPRAEEYQLEPQAYLKLIDRLKATVTIPVIASLNGCRPGAWTDIARRFELAGADAIELNLYQLATGTGASANEVEASMIETVSMVSDSVGIPVSVKISPFHTAPAQFAHALVRAGASGIVLFNRLYQPDFNLEDFQIALQLKLSDPAELPLRLRWLAILSPQLKASLSATGGVHSAEDVVKAVAAGADAVQLVSVVLQHGPHVISTILDGLSHWMTAHGYRNIDELRGAMNLRRCPDPAGYERANYQRILQSWQAPY
jgi:dihydroorotate dehydrogenase (fumarate)